MTKDRKTNLPNQTKILRNTLIKGVSLFILLNMVIALIPKGGRYGNLTLYNWLFPGRARLPFGENPDEAYNLSLFDLEVMFASHEIDHPRANEDDFKIILIGDSSVWGILQQPEETLAGMINSHNLESCDGRNVRAYNLGYPSMSLLKDLLILERSLRYAPDLIIWPVTLQSFPMQVQIETPLVANNPHLAKPLLSKAGWAPEYLAQDFIDPSFWDLTLIGRRRPIFDALQLQFYGMMWAATGIDQTYPENYSPALRDFDSDDNNFMDWPPPTLPLGELCIEFINTGHLMAEGTPILLVNEPILISEGRNNHVRYNFFYPHWAYDQYRDFLEANALAANWHFLDLWDIVPQEYFTNSAVHLSTQGTQIYLQSLLPALEPYLCP